MRRYAWFIIVLFFAVSTAQAEEERSDPEMLCHVEVENDGYHPAIAPPPPKPVLFVAEDGYLVIKMRECPRGIVIGRKVDGKPICGNRWLGTKL